MSDTGVIPKECWSQSLKSNLGVLKRFRVAASGSAPAAKAALSAQALLPK
ncbi:hypothetical protein HP499_16235 [Paenarthrobacter sp. CM16]|nr:hypothetical protein [Paenarthrobacter sp. CM16]NQD89335.1 hypothetical protein [Paenarthrobacter sp. CM16]